MLQIARTAKNAVEQVPGVLAAELRGSRDEAVEIIVDVSGVPVEAIRVLFRSGVVLVAGEKAPAASSPAQTFHLVEREFGRFARAVRVNGAFDVEHARAMLQNGELTIQLPKMTDRRGVAHRLTVTAAEPSA